jgi:plasmid stabilization system protein ParE
MHRLIVSKRAQNQLARAALWWSKNRDKAPEAFDEDLAEAYASLIATPRMGQPIPSRKGGLRRVLLPRIRYYLYYGITGDGDIEVTAFWHASRRPPRL